jgi:hypothetical protein
LFILPVFVCFCLLGSTSLTKEASLGTNCKKKKKKKTQKVERY